MIVADTKEEDHTFEGAKIGQFAMQDERKCQGLPWEFGLRAQFGSVMSVASKL
jgi:hypothetical protein